MPGYLGLVPRKRTKREISRNGANIWSSADLDLLPYLVEQDPNSFKDNIEASRVGRIVAHAEYRFRPKGWDWETAERPNQQANGNAIYYGIIELPQAVNVVLIYLGGGKAEDLLDYHCRYQDCFEPVNINTNASHLRKGLAKQLVTWLFPFCDEQGLDYKLMSSPIGRGLYKNCGFVEGVEGDKSAVQIDMGAWGGSGIYEHVYMVRYPERSGSGKAERGRGTYRQPATLSSPG
jgi:GNAT superfamily N-acetyltransferase